MNVVVVGAGLSGLAAADELTRRGHQVIVFDKGRSPGGRMATRRIGTARLDHGAQFFTIRSHEFHAFVQPLLDSTLVYEWCRGFTPEGDGYPRYAVRGGMNTLPKVLAERLDVRCNSMVFAIRRSVPGSDYPWNVALDDGSSLAADAVVVTCPLPQSYSLLVSAEVELPQELVRTEYDRTIALLVTLDRRSALEEPGGLQDPTPTLSFVADNQRKGVSPSPALTVHTNAEWSESHWDDKIDTVAKDLQRQSARFFGGAHVIEAQVKKWRLATPRSIWPDPCFVVDDTPGPLVLAGDAFAGPKVEGAVLSGFAAGRAIADAA